MKSKIRIHKYKNLFNRNWKNTKKWLLKRKRIPGTGTGTYLNVPVLVRDEITGHFAALHGRVSEPEPPGAGVFGWTQSRSRHFGPAPAPP